MAQFTTLTSCANSVAIILDPKLKTTTMTVTVSTGATGSQGFVQVTLDDPTSTPSPTITWANVSSAISSSASDGVGVIYTMLSPVGGVRYSLIGSTQTVAGTVTLKALQSFTG